MKRLILLAALVACGGLAAATPAAAAKPEILVLDNPSPSLAAFPNLDCGGGVTLEYVVERERLRIATYFDAAANPVRIVVNINIVGTFTNSATGEVFRDHGAVQYVLDPATRDVLDPETYVFISLTGRAEIFTAPGEGVLFHESGRKIFDESGNVVFAAGPKDFEELGGFDGMAAALC